MTLGLHPSTAGVLLLLALLGCGGDQRSGAAPATDTTQAPSSDTASAATSDTSAPARDTTASAGRKDTAARAGRTDTAAPRDTARTNVATKPAPKKPQRPRPAPAPRADTIRTDTARTNSAPSPTPAPATQADTSTTTSQSSDTSTSTQTAQADAPLRDQYHSAPLDTVPQQVYDGWKQYNLNCARCHGEDVQGTTIAPHLIVSVKPDGPINTKEKFVQTVCAGRPERGMPAWCPLGMEMPTIEAIYSYVKGRSEGKMHPGRPALRSGG